MTPNTLTQVARKNIKKAQSAWKHLISDDHAHREPQGHSRAKPGTGGADAYYRIEVRPKEQFITFRYQDVGRPGHTQRLAGKRSTGSWSTQAWLISKSDAHMERSRLVGDTREANKLLDSLATRPHHIKGDIFQAKDRPNIRKAQAARHG